VRFRKPGAGEGGVGRIGRAGIQLHKLEREAASRRSLYEAALVRSKKVQQQSDLLGPDGRMISAAAVPTEPSFPKLSVMTTVAFLESWVMGIGLAALREYFDRGFRTVRELEQGLGLSPSVSYQASAERSGGRGHTGICLRSRFRDTLRRSRPLPRR
jgi:hypothetical protein